MAHARDTAIESSSGITHCSICEQVCGLIVTQSKGRVTSIKPDKNNPYSWRDYCIKGASAGDHRDHPLRITKPMKRVGDRYVETSYEEAIDQISAKLKRLIAQYGPDTLGLYSGNPGALSFSSYGFSDALLDALGSRSKFMIGSIDHNALMVTAREMHGSEAVILLPDVDACDYFLLIGANPAVSKMSWLGKVSDGWTRLRKRLQGGARLTVVDPRRTETAAHATDHLAPRPGTDWALLLAMIAVIVEEDLVRLDHDDLIDNADQLFALARQQNVASLAAYCDVPEAEVRQIACDFARAPTAMAITRTGTAQGLGGTLAEWLTTALNMITGRIDVSGGRFMPAWPYSFPLADRATPKAGPPRPSRVRGLMPVGGGYSLAELPGEIETPGEGQIRALLINGGNPVVSGPQGQALDRALGKLDLLIAVDLLQRESHRLADWLIPASHFLERDEVHPYLHSFNDEPYIQASRAVMPTPDAMIPDWLFLRRLTEAMGVEPFEGAIKTPDDLANLMMQPAGLTADDVRAHPHGLMLGERTMGHYWDYLRTSGIKADLCPSNLLMLLQQRLETMAKDAHGNMFTIISRRQNSMMNSWLSDTTGAHKRPEGLDTIGLCQADIDRLDLPIGERVKVQSKVAALSLVLELDETVRPGVAMIEHGWGSRIFSPLDGDVAWCEGSLRNILVDNSALDPLSGTPRLNGMPVSIESF
ncbi:MAG: molybdopterin-dependent oxidoreductase [Sphingorhabdus sp.]